MKTSHVFWPCFFAFLSLFNHGFWQHEMKYLELDFELKKPKPFSIFDMPLPPNIFNPPLEIPKEKKLDPKDGNTADQKDHKSTGVFESAGQI